jgi:putative oxidoreductase
VEVIVDVVGLIGRILFAALFIASGVGHLTQTAAMAGYAGSKGVPQPKLAVQVSGILIIVGGLLVLLGIWLDLGALLIAIFAIPTAVLMHGFWREKDAQARQLEMAQFQKDLALGGAALLILALYGGYAADLGITITGPLF